MKLLTVLTSHSWLGGTPRALVVAKALLGMVG